MGTNNRPENWDGLVKNAQAILTDKKVSSVDLIISAIKQVNPTSHIHLSESDKEQAYSIKSDLQNYLLEHYPNLFDLEPTEWDENIVLIRYKVTPLIDACHAKLHLLSEKALEGLRKADPLKQARQKKKRPRMRSPENITVEGIAGCIDKARLYLDNYDYDAAREVLADMEIDRKQELPALLRGVSILRDEIGAYGTALDILLSVPDDLMGEELKEELANLYFLNNRLNDARGLFEECNMHELTKESVYRYANLLHRMSESRAGYDMLEFAERLYGHIDDIEALRRDINKVLKKEAEPYIIKARTEFDGNNFRDSEAEVRQALSICPDYDDARDLLKILRGIRSEDEVETLWKEYAITVEPSTKLIILNKLKRKVPDKEPEIDQRINEALIEQQQIRIQSMLKETTHLLERGNNEEVFEKLFALLQEEQGQNHARELADQFPHIQCVLGNEKLMSLKMSEARGCWFAYLELSAISNDIDIYKCEKLLKKAEKAFANDSRYRTIRKRYEDAIKNRSRQVIQTLLDKLQRDDITLEAAERLVPVIKKDLKGLPEQERDTYLNICETVLNRLRYELSVHVGKSRYEDYCNQIESENISIEEAARVMAAIEQESIYIPEKVHGEKKKILIPIIKKLQQSSYIECFRKSLLYGDTVSSDLYRGKIEDPDSVKSAEQELAALYTVDASQIDVVFNSDIHKAFSKKAEEDLFFICIIGREAFFNISIDKTNYLIILNIENATAWRYNLNNFHYKFEKVIHADGAEKIYHFLCEDTDDKFHYVRARLNAEDSIVLAQIDLSDVLHTEENSYIEDGLFLSDNRRFLYVLYLPDEDDWDDRRLAAIDLFEGTISKQRKVNSMGDTHATLPVSPPRLLLGDNNIYLFDDTLKKVKKVQVSKDRGSIDQISVDEQKRLLYIFKVAGKNDALLFAIMDFDFNIVEYHEDIAPQYDFSFREKYYDTSRDLICLHDMFYDYKKKRVIKSFGDDEFAENDFILFPESMVDLVQAIKEDGFDVSSDKEEVSNLDYLNVIISLPNLYEQISKQNKELQLSGDMLKNAEEIEELLVKSHDEIKDLERWRLKKFNRDLLEIIYPEFAPTVRELSDYCFFIWQDMNKYITCNYAFDKDKLTISDVSSYIDMIIDDYNRTIVTFDGDMSATE